MYQIGRQFSRILTRMWLVMLVFAFGANEVTATTTGALAPLKLPRPTFDELDNGREYGTFQGLREKQAESWVFDFSHDPNFENLLGAESLKSAILTLNLHSDELEINAPDSHDVPTLSNSDAADNHGLFIQTTTKIEVELLDIYSAEDLLKLFSEQAGKLPISYHDPEQISSVELQLIAEQPERTPGAVLLILSVVLLVSGLVGYVAHKKMSHKHESAPEERHHTRLAAVGEQTSTVIHDVKNSFAAIRGCAEIIADESLDPQERKEFAELIVSEIDRGVYMTQELLEFSRGRKPSLRLEEVSLHELLGEILAVQRQELQSHHIRLQTEIQTTDVLQLDPEKMRRVFMNLISNAKDAMPDGGNLTIRSVRHDARQVLVEFIDSGCGMPPEIVDRIFEPFMTRGKASGTGLGMAIVKDIIDAHQATIEVVSAENQGSTFRIFIPFRSVEQA